ECGLVETANFPIGNPNGHGKVAATVESSFCRMMSLERLTGGSRSRTLETSRRFPSMSAAIAPRLRTLRTIFLACAVNFFFAHTILFAQKTPQAQTAPQAPANEQKSTGEPLVFKSVVRRVVVDVVVTGPDGKPVHGLNREDFSVAEDGKAQRVLSFDV